MKTTALVRLTFLLIAGLLLTSGTQPVMTREKGPLIGATLGAGAGALRMIARPDNHLEGSSAGQ